MHEVDEITNIVTDVVGDPTLPRLVTQIFFSVVWKKLIIFKDYYIVFCSP